MLLLQLFGSLGVIFKFTPGLVIFAPFHLWGRGEQEFPFTTIPRNTDLPFPFLKIGNEFSIPVFVGMLISHSRSRPQKSKSHYHSPLLWGLWTCLVLTQVSDLVCKRWGGWAWAAATVRAIKSSAILGSIHMQALALTMTHKSQGSQKMATFAILLLFGQLH